MAHPYLNAKLSGSISVASLEPFLAVGVPGTPRAAGSRLLAFWQSSTSSGVGVNEGSKENVLFTQDDRSRSGR